MTAAVDAIMALADAYAGRCEARYSANDSRAALEAAITAALRARLDAPQPEPVVPMSDKEIRRIWHTVHPNDPMGIDRLFARALFAAMPPLYASPPTAAAQPPEGWRIVPIVATDGMITAAALDSATAYSSDAKLSDSMRSTYAAMIAAAPTPPTEPVALDKDEEIYNLRKALEVIAVGDSPDPVRDAGDELVALGYWRAEGLAGHRAELAKEAIASTEPVAHEWVTLASRGTKTLGEALVCAKCGIMKNRDGNKPCKGVAARIALRSDDALAEPVAPMLSDAEIDEIARQYRYPDHATMIDHRGMARAIESHLRGGK